MDFHVKPHSQHPEEEAYNGPIYEYTRAGQTVTGGWFAAVSAAQAAGADCIILNGERYQVLSPIPKPNNPPVEESTILRD